MVKKNTLLFFLFSVSIISAQDLWTKLANAEDSFSKSELSLRKSTPTKFDIYSLNVDGFKRTLSTVSENTEKIVLLPSINGVLNRFLIKEDSNFLGKLNPQYGFIKSYSAQGLDDPTAVAKLSIGSDGIHIMIMSGNHATFYVDPYTKDNNYYISYTRKDLTKTQNDFNCEFDEKVEEIKTSKRRINSSENADDSLLRNYRLALACTVEYAQFHLNEQGVSSIASDAVKKAAVLSAMNSTMTRVNGIFERDLSVKMTLVNNNADIIFINSDNLDNNNAQNALLNQIQGVIDDVIGNNNYDIGHVFSTGGGGVAAFQSVCVSNQKARGVTGRGTPINDPFDIDFVAHEIGHQFGASHTYNNSCEGNRVNSTAVEPGSGSTIMAYAGICAPNVQNNSDDYFHAISIDQMWTHIQVLGSCRDGVATNTNNAAPTANAGLDVTIPKSTPFVLRGIATDADGVASLTYNWEQQDNEISTQAPQATSTGGPNFRSLPSSTSPDRYMPALRTVIGGSTSSTWEVVSDVARTMSFSLVVRDNKAGGGASARDDVEITVSDANPFTVTSQNSAVTWDTGTNQTITWNKSTTDVAPINVSNVRIKLSTDGGVTFPITLVESTPNDGTHTLSVPNEPTTSARIMVEAIGNVFYNVNSTNFIINSTTSTFVFSNTTGLKNACNLGGASVDYILNLDFVNGFSEDVSFTAANGPAGANISFSQSIINSNGNVTMTVSNFDGATTQLYTIEVTGTSSGTSVVQKVNAELLVLDNSFGSLTLSAPVDAASGVSIAPELIWNEDSNATSYDVEIATSAAFTSIVASSAVNTNSYKVSPVLSGNTTYFWRVKPKNDCGEGVFSEAFSFTTEIPSYCTSDFRDEAGGTEFISNVTFNEINNDSGNDIVDGYQDFTEITTTVNIGEEHQISVTFDTGGFQDHCYVFIDWNQDFIFNSTNERYDLGSQTIDVATVTFNINIPSDAATGNTRMRVVIEYDDPNNNYGEGPCNADHLTEWGETEDYTIEVINPTASIEDYAFSGFNLYPNPSNGEIKLSFDVENTDEVNTELYDIRGRKISQKTFKNVSSNFSERLVFDKVSTGIYLLKIKNGGKQTTRKIIIK